MKSKTKTVAAATSLLLSKNIFIFAQEAQQNEPIPKTIIKSVKKSSSSQRQSKKGFIPRSSSSSSFSASSFSWTMQDENATYLDVFGEVAKDILTNQIIPATTASCDWNWMHLRCEPFCDCSYQPLWGDYHLGRSCRARRGGGFVLEDENRTDTTTTRTGSSSSSNDGYDSGDVHDKDSFLIECKNPPNTMVYKGMRTIGNGLKFVWNIINWRIRLETARNKMCDSLSSRVGSTTRGDEGQEQGYDNEHEDDELSSGDSSQHYLLEKPVRALRRSLHCNNRDNVFVSNRQQKENPIENFSDATYRGAGVDEVKNDEGEEEADNANDEIVPSFVTTMLKNDLLSSTSSSSTTIQNVA